METIKTLIKTSLLFIAISSFTFTNAQCARNASDFGNNTGTPIYNITGDVTITLDANGQTISLDTGINFMTAMGPDVNAYLVKSNGMTNAQIAATPLASLENIHFGLISSNTVSPNGAKSFTVTIPNGVNIEEYDTVFFYCFQFSAFWDLGKITPFTTANCSVLGIDDNLSNSQIKAYPNPVNDKLYLNNNTSKKVQVKIYAILGNLIFDKNLNTKTDFIDLSELKSGTYFAAFSTDNSRLVKKIIKL